MNDLRPRMVAVRWQELDLFARLGGDSPQVMALNPDLRKAVGMCNRLTHGWRRTRNRQLFFVSPIPKRDVPG